MKSTRFHPIPQILLAACLALALAACGGAEEEPADTGWTPLQMAQAIRQKPAAHCFGLGLAAPEHRSMNQIGG